MRGLGGKLSRTFIYLMIFAGTLGVALFVLGKVAEYAGRNQLTSPVGAVAARYRQFATTGS